MPTPLAEHRAPTAKTLCCPVSMTECFVQCRPVPSTGPTEFGTNNQLHRNIENALVQVALSDRASLFAEYRHSELKSGDVRLPFYSENFNPSASETENSSQYRLGGRFDVAPGLTLVGVWTRQDATAATDIPAYELATNIEGSGDFGEAALYLSRPAIQRRCGRWLFRWSCRIFQL